VHVISFAQLSRKIFKILPLREASKLRNIIQPDVYDALDSSPAQGFEESLSGFFREADRKQIHSEPCASL
jgi:hypothetical protein